MFIQLKLIDHHLHPIITLIGKPTDHQFREIIIAFYFTEIIFISTSINWKNSIITDNGTTVTVAGDISADR